MPFKISSVTLPLWLAALAFLCRHNVRGSPISHPLVSDQHLDSVIPDYFDTKRSNKAFHRLQPNAAAGYDAQEISSHDMLVKSSTKHARSEGGATNIDFRLKWSTTLGSPIYSTPVLFPSGLDGKKQIFVNTYYQFVELLNSDGFKSWGWPISFEESSFQSSPILYDVDGDGNIDMGIVDKNANMFWVRIGEFGEFLEDYHIQIPKLKIKRRWAEGLDPNFVDTYVMLSMFDRGGDRDSAEAGAGPAAPASSVKRARPDDLKSMKLVRPPAVYPGISAGPSDGASGEGSVLPPKAAASSSAEGPPRMHRRLQETAQIENPDIQASHNMAGNEEEQLQQLQQLQQQEDELRLKELQQQQQQQQELQRQQQRQQEFQKQQEEVQRQQLELQQQQVLQQHREIEEQIASEITISRDQEPAVQQSESQQQQQQTPVENQQLRTLKLEEQESAAKAEALSQLQQQQSDTSALASASSMAAFDSAQQQVGVRSALAESIALHKQASVSTEVASELPREDDDYDSAESYEASYSYLPPPGLNRSNAMRFSGDQTDDFVPEEHESYYQLPGQHVDDHDDVPIPADAAGEVMDAEAREREIALKLEEYRDLKRESKVADETAGADDDAAVLEKIKAAVDHRHVRHSHHHHSGDGSSGNSSSGDGNEHTTTDDDIRTAADADGHSYGYGIGRVPAADDGMAYYMSRAYGGFINESEFLEVDAHVLASPALVDVNGDGHMEIIYSVSYYFDKADYANRDVDFDPDMYVAGGIACWDVQEQYWAWLVHLDLTTAKSEFQAMIYSSPTVADLDGDGKHEVIIGTALGLLYVLDGESGFVRRFFPMQFHSIQAQVAVGDVTGGRDLEMVVADMAGTVALVNMHGDILWDVQLSGAVPFTPTLGDVDGDGQIDIIVVAEPKNHQKQQKGKRDSGGGSGSHIYALRGDTGEVLPGYPISLPGRASVSAPVLLVDLHERTAAARFTVGANRSTSSHDGVGDTQPRQPLILEADQPFPMDFTHTASANTRTGAALDSREGRLGTSGSNGHGVSTTPGMLHLVITSFDGNVYIIEGGGHPVESLNTTTEVKHQKMTFNAQRIDIGEHIYSVPLIDDITGNGYMDLLVGTLNGQLLLFETFVPFHTVNAWNSFPKHRVNGFTSCDMGISLPREEKEKLRHLDIKGGSNLSIAFDIWDARYNKAVVAGDSVSYKVAITRGSRRIDELWSAEFTSPGRYVATLRVSPPDSFLLLLTMKTEHGNYFEDSVHVALSTRFYIWLKYMILVPTLFLATTFFVRFRTYL